MRIGRAAVAIVFAAVVIVAVVTAILSGAPGDPARTAGDDPAVVAGTPAQFAIRGRWADPRQLSYRLEVGTSPIGDEAFARAVQRATEVWSATGVVGFRPAQPEQAADVTLGWRRGHHGACLPFGPGADVAHTGPVEPGTFVHFDLDRSWSENGENGTSVFGTALHELGHVLGLGHSEAEAAVMSTNPDRPTALSFDDVAAIHSLYGGGDDAPGDLVISQGGVVAATLRRVAPPDTCAYAVFDCDGDGKADVIVWRTDPAGHGALTVYYFDTGPLLVRSLGPFYGAVAPNARVEFVTAPDGARLLVCTFADGRQLVRELDRFGVPVQPTAPPSPELLANATVPDRGDLDGDGSIESVARPARDREPGGRR